MQPGFLNAEIDRVRTVISSEPAWTQSLVGFAGFLFFVGIADLETPPAATFKDPEYIAGLAYLPTRHRINRRKKALKSLLLTCRFWALEQDLRLAVLVIAFAK